MSIDLTKHKDVPRTRWVIMWNALPKCVVVATKEQLTSIVSDMQAKHDKAANTLGVDSTVIYVRAHEVPSYNVK